MPATYSVSTVTPVPATLPADGTTTSTVTALILDGSGNPAPTDTEVDWALSPLTSGTLSAPTSTTDSTGAATVGVTASVAGDLVVTATTADDTTGKNATITVTSATTYSVSTITSYPATLPVDGSVAATVTALILDDTGNPAPADIEVDWALSPDTAGTVAPSSTTDSTGKATVSLTVTGATAGTVLQVTATTADDITGKVAAVYVSNELPAPTVSGASAADNYTIDQYDLQLGVQMTIPHYPNAAAGDTVTFYWGVFSHSSTLTDPSTELPMVININTELPSSDLEDGSYQVFYTASDAAGNASCSTGLELTIANGGNTPQTLTRPSVPEGADGYINITDATGGVEVDISYPSMAVGDAISVYWEASDTAGNPLPEVSFQSLNNIVDVVQTLPVTVPESYFYLSSGQGYQGTADVYYTVLVQGETKSELSFDLTVSVDTVPPGSRA